MTTKADRVVLAYSGGLDTSVAIGWIGEQTGAEVVAVAVDEPFASAGTQYADGALCTAVPVACGGQVADQPETAE